VNTRRYPRTMQEAFGPYTDDQLAPLPVRSLSDKLAEFAAVWWQYRRAHSCIYAARIAYGIAFRGLSF
jgi:hypothetical protein